MKTLLAPETVPQNPRITFAGPTTLWVVASDDFSTSYRIWRGPRTVAALEAALRREWRAGRGAHLELETAACSSTALTVAELAALGVLS